MTSFSPLFIVPLALPLYLSRWYEISNQAVLSAAVVFLVYGFNYTQVVLLFEESNDVYSNSIDDRYICVYCERCAVVYVRVSAAEFVCRAVSG